MLYCLYIHSYYLSNSRSLIKLLLNTRNFLSQSIHSTIVRNVFTNSSWLDSLHSLRISSSVYCATLAPCISAITSSFVRFTSLVYINHNLTSNCSPLPYKNLKCSMLPMQVNCPFTNIPTLWHNASASSMLKLKLTIYLCVVKMIEHSCLFLLIFRITSLWLHYFLPHVSSRNRIHSCARFI